MCAGCYWNCRTESSDSWSPDRLGFIPLPPHRSHMSSGKKQRNERLNWEEQIKGSVPPKIIFKRLREMLQLYREEKKEEAGLCIEDREGDPGLGGELIGQNFSSGSSGFWRSGFSVIA